MRRVHRRLADQGAVVGATKVLQIEAVRADEIPGGVDGEFEGRGREEMGGR